MFLKQIHSFEKNRMSSATSEPLFYKLRSCPRIFFSSFLSLFLLFSGCASKPSFSSFEYISDEIESNVGVVIPSETQYGQKKIPEGISLDDGLSEQDAVAIALWNNVGFQADLSELGISRAEVLRAGLIQNPNFSLLFPVGTKQLEAILYWSITEFQNRPRRVAKAKLDAKRVADNLIQNGLNLSKETQIAFANLLQAQKILALETAKTRLVSEISEITQARFLLGDISELDANSKIIDQLNSINQKNKLANDEKVFRQNLRFLLGIDSESDLSLTPMSPYLSPEKDIDALLKIAFASRPDLRIAELEIESAGEQIGWEESQIYNFILILDANEIDKEVGPGIRFDLPIFNKNEGGIELAQAQLRVAANRYLAIKEKISLAVRESHTKYLAALERFDLVTQKILPQQEQAARLSDQALKNGEISYLSNLNVQRDLIQIKIQQAEVLAELWRSRAQLGHSIGRPVDLLKAYPL